MRLVALTCRWLPLCLSLAFSLRAEVQVVRQAVGPNRIRPEIVILPEAWAVQIPPTGSVNAPEDLSDIYPGQNIALALITEGPDRDQLLRGATVTVHFTSPTTGVTEFRDLPLMAIRPVKADGADMALVVLKAGGISADDQVRMGNAATLVSFAIFQTDWTAPNVDQTEKIQISANLSGHPGDLLKPASLTLHTAADWLKEPALTQLELGRFLNRYHGSLTPGRLLSLLQAAAHNDGLKANTVACFFARAFQANSAARTTALTQFPSLDPTTQAALLFVLRLGGQDISSQSRAVSAETVEFLKTVEPLRDPRRFLQFQEPITSQSIRGMGNTMDECWSGWMATGDQSYLRALVGLLAWAPDYPAYQSWLKAKGGAKGFNPGVARGIIYQIAGWSLGSFRRTDPLVTDWLLYWENDPAFSPVLRKELAALPTNPAFRRQ